MFKHFFVKGDAFLGIVVDLELDECVCQTLDADTNRTVPHVGVPALGRRVVVVVDDAVEVARHSVGDFEELVVVERAVLLDKLRDGDGGQVAHRHFVGRGVLDDLGAQVGRADGAQILLVGLAVGGVLVQDVRRARLDLRVQDGKPELLRLHGLAHLARRLVLLVQRLKLLAPRVDKAGALVGAHESPVCVRHDSLHEQVWDPHRVEEVSSSVLLSTEIFLQLKKLTKNFCQKRNCLQVYKGPCFQWA